MMINALKMILLHGARMHDLSWTNCFAMRMMQLLPLHTLLQFWSIVLYTMTKQMNLSPRMA
ncbi:hypothetical protein ACS0TY_004503 [Phlomoides rotata]